MIHTIGFRKDIPRATEEAVELERKAAHLLWLEVSKHGATLATVIEAVAPHGIRNLQITSCHPEMGVGDELYGGVMIKCSYRAEWNGKSIHGELSKGIIARMPQK